MQKNSETAVVDGQVIYLHRRKKRNGAVNLHNTHTPDLLAVSTLSTCFTLSILHSLLARKHRCRNRYILFRYKWSRPVGRHFHTSVENGTGFCWWHSTTQSESSGSFYWSSLLGSLRPACRVTEKYIDYDDGCPNLFRSRHYSYLLGCCWCCLYDRHLHHHRFDPSVLCVAVYPSCRLYHPNQRQGWNQMTDAKERTTTDRGGGGLQPRGGAPWLLVHIERRSAISLTTFMEDLQLMVVTSWIQGDRTKLLLRVSLSFYVCTHVSTTRKIKKKSATVTN